MRSNTVLQNIHWICDWCARGRMIISTLQDNLGEFHELSKQHSPIQDWVKSSTPTYQALTLEGCTAALSTFTSRPLHNEGPGRVFANDARRKTVEEVAARSRRTIGRAARFWPSSLFIHPLTQRSTGPITVRGIVLLERCTSVHFTRPAVICRFPYHPLLSPISTVAHRYTV